MERSTLLGTHPLEEKFEHEKRGRGGGGGSVERLWTNTIQPVVDTVILWTAAV